MPNRDRGTREVNPEILSKEGLMNPLKVSFRFRSPVLVDSEHPIHLDGLLSYGLMREMEEMESSNPWEESLDLSEILEKTDGTPWVWKASQLEFVSGMAPFSATHLMTNMIRRCDPEQVYADLGQVWESGRKIGPAYKVDSRSGQQRGYQWLAASQWIKEATAWAIGDIDAVRHYLGFVEFVGKQGRNGYGRISEISVEPVVAESEKENWKRRCLPEEIPGLTGINYEPALTTIRPPYWRRTDRQRVLVPVI